ncbi:MAG: hypothetical protein HQM12_23730, partial [SAR324 cluster bacterium]|nr:hypothetical protein [SAR324 cluster bacterium]
MTSNPSFSQADTSPEKFFPIFRTSISPGFCLVLTMLLSACVSSRPSVADRLEAASRQHEQTQQTVGLISPDKTGEPQAEPSAESSATNAPVSRISQGDTSPEWVERTPSDNEFYYAVSFVDCPENPNACREQAETVGRDTLRKSISVEVRSVSRSAERSLTDQENRTFQKEYEAVIQERGRKMELEDVSFSHFYHVPTRQLQTLTRLPKQDRLERELGGWLEQNRNTLPKQLAVGPFMVRGERRESLLSFYTGEFLYQRISVNASAGAASRFVPSTLNEMHEDYWKRQANSEDALLFGEYLLLDDRLKLSLSLREPNAEPRFLAVLNIRLSALSRQLLSMTRASIATVEKTRQSWSKARILFLRDSGEPLSGETRALALLGNEVAEILRQSGLEVSKPEDWGDLQGNALRDKIAKTMNPQPETLAV